jgi:uncharacterized protein (DUF58 family)
MHTISRHSDVPPVIDREALHALGVLVPIRFHPVRLLPGRHPLGRAGDGMRLLRTRPFVTREDNPRDVDKFSPPNRRRVVEWEDEAQASVMLLADTSASMAPPIKAALRNACLVQLTYSLWRAGDRVGTTFFDGALHEPIRAANLRMQMQLLAAALARSVAANTSDVSSVLRRYLDQGRNQRSDLLFVISDFVTNHGDDIEPESDWRPIMSSMRRNVVPVIVSFEITDKVEGVTKLWDAERGVRRLTWFSSSRVRRINQWERDRVSSLVRKFRAAGLDYMVLSSQHQTYPQLARLARMRRLRKH